MACGLSPAVTHERRLRQDVAEAWVTWRVKLAHARAVYADLDLNALIEVDRREAEARDIVVHLVEEYAHHVGHTDLLRESMSSRSLVYAHPRFEHVIPQDPDHLTHPVHQVHRHDGSLPESGRCGRPV